MRRAAVELSNAATGRPGRNLVALARPYFGLILLTTLLLSILGFAALLKMPSGIYPEVAFPRIVVIAECPNLAVKDVEVSLTRPIEGSLSTVLGASRVQSKTVRGAAELSIDFDPRTDMIQALNDVRARMAEVSPQFPLQTSTIVERQTPSVFPIISFAVTGNRDAATLYEYAKHELRPRITRIPDVSYVKVQGGDVREILVELKPESIVAAGLSISDVADRLGKGHRLKAVGRIDRKQLQYQVIVNTQAVLAEDLEQRVVAEKNGQPIRVCDVGSVSISHEDRTMVVRANGSDAVAVTVFRRYQGNALAVSRRLDAVLSEAALSAPEGIKIVPIYDQAMLVRTAVANVRDAIIVGAALSVVVLLFFLKSIRATLIACLAIPISLLVTFLFLYLTGETLNLMTLGGLAVAIGLIIDDAVVVIENIARHLSLGESGDAVINLASREISGAVIGSTMTTILVFLPLAYASGVVGQFFQSLSISLTVALLVSMVVSLTIAPILAARFLGRRGMASSGPIYNSLAVGYESLLRVALRHPKLTLAAALLTIIPAGLLFPHLKTGFMPDLDESAFVLDYEMPVGTSLAQTNLVMRRVETILQKTPGVEGYIRRTGAELGLFATQSNTGDVLVSLTPPGTRRPVSEIFDELRGALEKQVPELSTELIPLVRDQISDLSGVHAPIEVRVFGQDLAVLREFAGEIGHLLETVPGAVDVNAHIYLGNPDIVIRPDSVETARVGLTEMEIESQLNAALNGQIAGTIAEQDKLTNIRVRYPDSVRFDQARLGRLPISIPQVATAAPAGAAAARDSATAAAHVPLDQLASIDVVRSPNELMREDQQPVITVTAEIADRDLGSVVKDVRARLARVVRPVGCRWELAGNYLAQRESFRSLVVVLVVAAVLVFLSLGFQFRSLTLPLLIFLSQPISLASAEFALWITGTPLNVSSFMGLILLVGLDVKNGILLVERIGQLRRDGLPLRQALLRAGRNRFRPILMTSSTAILGLLPLALGFGPGAQMQQPLAIAVIGGLIANVLVTRMLIPVGYLLLSRAPERSAVAAT